MVVVKLSLFSGIFAHASAGGFGSPLLPKPDAYSFLLNPP